MSCLCCGFVYADIIPDQQRYDAFYASSSKYENKKTTTGGGASPWDLRRLEDTAKYLMEAWPDRTKRIVDIGCANGGLLQQLKTMGYVNLCGIDPSFMCVENTRDRGIKAYTGSLFSLPEEVGLFDGAILSHVLEHIIDLNGAMQSVAKHINLGGQVYVELPDASCYAEHVFSPYQEFNTEHINHFSTAALRNLMQANGFQLSGDAGEKLIESSPDMPYPVIYSLWRKVPAPHRGYIFERDNALRACLENYIDESQRMMEDIQKKLKATLSQHPQLILWGTGQLLMKLLAETALGQARIVALIDGNSVNHGKTIQAIPILAPDEIRRYDAPILITSLLHQREIYETIRGMNIKNDVFFLL